MGHSAVATIRNPSFSNPEDAFLNHDDSRGLNTFDSFVEQDGRTFIRHYLLDFGSNLGSGSTNPREPRAGNEYYIAGGPALMDAADAFWAASIPEQAWGPADDVGYRYVVAAIRTMHPDHPLWEEPVLVTLRDRNGELDVVGIERPRYDPVPLP